MASDTPSYPVLSKPALIGAIGLSGGINILAFSGPLFMLEVYDRAIPSRSLPTLSALIVLVAGLYAFSGLLDALRARVMTRLAALFDTALSGRIFTTVALSSLRARHSGDALRAAQDADQIRQFLAGAGPMALFDLPWMPVYLAVCFLLHPLIGCLAVGAMVILTALTLLIDWRTRKLTRDAAAALSRRNRFGEAAFANAEALAAMGMADRAGKRWAEAHDAYAVAQRRGADVASGLGAASKAVRYGVQSGSLGLGAYLVIHGDMSGGSIIAASIIVARALAPVEQLIGNWRTMIGARQAWTRLKAGLALFPQESAHTALPAPCRSLTVSGLFLSPPGDKRLTVQNVGFTVQSGTAIGIIGPSASGKSSLVRGLTGVWSLARGSVRLDGAALDQWPAEARGRHIGYMPQSSDLFPGTIAENIARLDRQADDSAIVAAAKAAGVHEMIVSLPEGYETEVGPGGTDLSAGQRQRVALARALYGEPFLVVLDEPNANLDVDGDKALADAILSVKARGGIVLIVAHRNSVLGLLDQLLVMEAGVMKSFGPRDAVLARIREQRPKAPRTAATAPALAVIDGEAVAQ